MKTNFPDNNTGSNKHSPKYKGVRKRKWGKYVSEIRLPNSRERIWLGSFDSPEKAARAFDAALFCLRGPTASFNFPDHPPKIPSGCSLSPAEIQSVAGRFANEQPLLPPQRPEEEVDNGSGNTAMDWSFLETLDNDVGPSAFGYSFGRDMLYNDPHQTPSTPSYNFYDDCESFVDEDYSQHYSLWNFK